MKIIINEFGSYLSKKENRFVIKNKDKKEEGIDYYDYKTKFSPFLFRANSE
ncbi:hypothetical protein HY450_03740 [Candidatus Pacearchaeota archaeon]|nr:hypothetical protein [Candidatus Pacearchaeota archaeon]